MWLLLPCGACPKHQAGPQPGAKAYRLGREEVILAHPAAAGASVSSNDTDVVMLCVHALQKASEAATAGALLLLQEQLLSSGPFCCVVCLAL